MRERDLNYWKRLVEKRSVAEGHALSDDVVTELAMFLADVYLAQQDAGDTSENAERMALGRLDRATFEGVAERHRARPQRSSEQSRPANGGSESILASLWSDLSAAAGALIAARGFTLTAVLTMAAGLALATVILTVVNAYILRGLPYPESDRLYQIDYGPFPRPEGMDTLDWSSLSDIIELMVALEPDGFQMLGGEYPEAAQGSWASPGFMKAMNVRASTGRIFTPEEYQEGGPNVAMISDRLWRTRFGGNPAIVGSTFNAYLSDRDFASTFTIVGVLPADLWLMNTFSDVIAPLRGSWSPYQLRLRPSVPPEVVTSRIDALIRQGATGISPQFAVTVESVQSAYVAQVRPMLWSIVVGTGLVVLIAATNVAVLMIMRAHKRERELSVRVALGASHLRIARMVTLEGLLIGALSTSIGLATAAAVLPSLGPSVEHSLNRRIPGGLTALSLDPTVLLIGLSFGAAVTLLFTLVPVAMLWWSRSSIAVAGSLRGITGAPGSGRSRAALISIEVAASLTLLAGAALMADSARRMLQVDFGIDGRAVTTAMLAVRQSAFPENLDRALLYERLDRELSGVSGNTGVALGYWPLATPPSAHMTTVQSIAAEATSQAVTPGYFDAVGMRMIEGRKFTAADRLGSEAVIVVSASLARHLWPQGSALGQSLAIQGQDASQPTNVTVVGVVNDVRQTHLDNELFDAYVPLFQNPLPYTFLYLRGPLVATWGREVRSAIARIHPEISIDLVRPMEHALERERARPRFLAYLLSTFAVTATILALVGMHGVIAYAVRQRQREIAVRIAIGADPRAVTAMFLRYGAWVVGVGMLLGVGGALGLGRVLQSQLHGAGPAEPRVVLTAVTVFAVVAFIAVLWPARRAASVDPLVVLKDE